MRERLRWFRGRKMLVVVNGAMVDRAVLVAIAGALGFELVRSGEGARRAVRGGADQPMIGVSLGGSRRKRSAA